MRSGALAACLALLASIASTASRAAEQVIEVATRPGIKVRALLEQPPTPVASVILFAGGHGNLSLGADGSIGWGKGNQLVRTRSRYAAAGLAAMTPDIAPDFKRGRETTDDYRWSKEHAADIGKLVEHMRKLAAPVHLVGTSRGTLSVANAAARLTGAQRPDGIVLTSGLLMAIRDDRPSVQSEVRNLSRITMPVLIVFHEADGCSLTPASSGAPFRKLLTKAAKADLVILKGGEAGTGDPCQAYSHHGFLGQDADVVALIARWLEALGRS